MNINSSIRNIKRRLNQERLLKEHNYECLEDLEKLIQRCKKIIIKYIEKKNDLTDENNDLTQRCNKLIKKNNDLTDENNEFRNENLILKNQNLILKTHFPVIHEYINDNSKKRKLEE